MQERIGFEMQRNFERECAPNPVMSGLATLSRKRMPRLLRRAQCACARDGGLYAAEDVFEESLVRRWHRPRAPSASGLASSRCSVPWPTAHGRATRSTRTSSRAFCRTSSKHSCSRTGLIPSFGIHAEGAHCAAPRSVGDSVNEDPGYGFSVPANRCARRLGRVGRSDRLLT
jgi:hypothetical protein